jgi:hypothetical protein
MDKGKGPSAGVESSPPDISADISGHEREAKGPGKSSASDKHPASHFDAEASFKSLLHYGGFPRAPFARRFKRLGQINLLNLQTEIHYLENVLKDSVGPNGKAFERLMAALRRYSKRHPVPLIAVPRARYL